MPYLSAVAISKRTRSSGLSSRRPPCSVREISQRFPITAISTSQEPGTDACRDCFNEVDARLDGVDIHKAFARREVLRQAIVNQPGPSRTIITAVTDEDLATHSLPGEKQNEIEKNPLWGWRIDLLVL
jgi:hypothetical protein